MVESVGICETHELPLDRHGECELCRLSLVPSKAPPSSSPWWALIIPLLLLGAGIVWALSSFGAETEVAPQRGVNAAQPQPGAAGRAKPAPPEPNREPESAPAPAELPTADEGFPMDDLPVPAPPPQPQ